MIPRRAPNKHCMHAIERHAVFAGFIAAISTLIAQAAGPQTATLAMQPQKNFFRETCFTLESGQQLAYQLSTPHAIEFNLHHHQNDGAMSYPDKLVVKSKHSKQLVAATAGPYCFMATNLDDQPGDFDVVINYEISTR